MNIFLILILYLHSFTVYYKSTSRLEKICAGWLGYKSHDKVDLGCDNKNLNVVSFPYTVFLNLLLKDDTYFSICNSRHPTPEQTFHYLLTRPVCASIAF